MLASFHDALEPGEETIGRPTPSDRDAEGGRAG